MATRLEWIREHAAVVSAIAAVVVIPILLSGEIRGWLSISSAESEVSTSISRVRDSSELGSAQEQSPQSLESPEELALQEAAVEISRPSQKELWGILMQSTAQIYDVPVSSIRDDANFVDDFPADPEAEKYSWLGDLRLVELIILVEQTAGCKIEDDAAETIRTVGDLVAVAIPRCARSQ